MITCQFIHLLQRILYISMATFFFQLQQKLLHFWLIFYIEIHVLSIHTSKCVVNQQKLITFILGLEKRSMQDHLSQYATKGPYINSIVIAFVVQIQLWCSVVHWDYKRRVLFPIAIFCWSKVTNSNLKILVNKHVFWL